MAKSQRISLLIGILIIATFFRFYHLTTVPPGLYPDEAIDGNNAAEAAAAGRFPSFYTEDNGREGLYINIIALMFKWFEVPHEPWVIRLPAAVAGVLTVLGLYLLATELFGSAAGLLAAFFTATSFWHINFSRIGFRAILAPLLLTWSLYLLIKAFKSASSRSALLHSALAGAIYALGFYTYIAYRITPLLFLLFIPFFKRYPDFGKRAAVFIVAAFLVAAPIGLYFLKHPGDFFGRTSQIAVTNSASPVGHFAANLAKTFLMFNVRGDDNWRHNLSGAPELFWPVGILFVIGALLAIRALVSRLRSGPRRENVDTWPPSSLLLVLSWMVLAAFPAAASDEGIPHALRSILMLPPAMIFAALGGIWLYHLVQKQGGAVIARTIAAFFLSGTAVAAYMTYFIIWAQNPNVAGAFNASYAEIGYAINALPTSMPKYVVVEASGVDTRGIPMPAETTIFITDTFLPEQQAAKNVHYILPAEASRIPPGAVIFHIR